MKSDPFGRQELPDHRSRIQRINRVAAGMAVAASLVTGVVKIGMIGENNDVFTPAQRTVAMKEKFAGKTPEQRFDLLFRNMPSLYASTEGLCNPKDRNNLFARIISGLPSPEKCGQTEPIEPDEMIGLPNCSLGDVEFTPTPKLQTSQQRDITAKLISERDANGKPPVLHLRFVDSAPWVGALDPVTSTTLKTMGCEVGLSQ